MKTQFRQFGHSFQGFQSFWKEHRVRSIDRCYGQRREHIAMVVDDGDDFFATLMFVAGVANTIAAFFGYCVGAITMKNTQIELAVGC